MRGLLAQILTFIIISIGSLVMVGFGIKSAYFLVWGSLISFVMYGLFKRLFNNIKTPPQYPVDQRNAIKRHTDMAAKRIIDSLDKKDA
jgi:hypothetical protein